MKIAVLGSAPSSISKAPFGDATWEIWACSPGAYPKLARVNEFWEVHRWEPGVIGKADTQKPWFSPEYVEWLKRAPVVWVSDPAAMQDLPNAKMLPLQELVAKYGHYVWTSSVAYMTAMAIEKILAARAAGDASEHVIGFFGIDMAANEELYSGQRAALQFFLQVLNGLKIIFYIPPESDLAVPPPMYGVCETSHRMIKWTERKRELETRLAHHEGQLRAHADQALFVKGALDDLDYMLKMWMHQGEDSVGFDFEQVFPEIARERAAQVVPPQPPAEEPEPKRRRLARAGQVRVIPPKGPGERVAESGKDPSSTLSSSMTTTAKS